MSTPSALVLFERVVSDIESGEAGPIRFRHLLLAALAVETSDAPLPSTAQRACKTITGMRHKTYGAAARSIADKSFNFSGRYLRTVLLAGLDPSIEEAMYAEAAKNTPTLPNEGMEDETAEPQRSP